MRNTILDQTIHLLGGSSYTILMIHYKNAYQLNLHGEMPKLQLLSTGSFEGIEKFITNRDNDKVAIEELKKLKNLYVSHLKRKEG